MILNAPTEAAQPEVPLIKEHDTRGCGLIRCYRVSSGTSSFVLIEETDASTSEIVWRPVADMDEAGAFILDRESAYEDLWNGA